MVVNFRGKTTQVDDVICNPQCQTKWNSRQPKLVMRGYTKGIVFMIGKRNKKVTAIIL